MFEIFAADYAALNSIPAPCEVIPMPLGYQGEDGARCVIFDLSTFASEIGAGTASVVAQRHEESVPYVATDVEQVDNKLIWTITNVDNGIAGYGYAQVRYVVNEDNVRTAVYKTVVYESLGAAGPTPSPSEDIIEEIKAFAEAAEAAATAAAASAESANADAQTASAAATTATTAATSAAASAETAQAAATTLAITEDSSGAIATFTDGANGLPVVDLTAQINPVQSGTGIPSPSNIRPISGWNGVNVKRTGKNLLNKSAYTYLTAINIAWGGDTQTVDGSFMLPAGTYTFSASEARTGIYIATEAGELSRKYNAASLTFTLAEKAAIRILVYQEGSTAEALLALNYQLEVGSTATAYTPYAGDTYTVDWSSEAGTVYGGSIDLTTGVLTVTHVEIAAYAGETLPGGWISDRDVYSAGATPTTGAQVVYELATPQTYQLDPVEVRTLLGDNNIYADTGAVDVAYRADTKLYIDNAIASLQASEG